jgi:hypothetical protein
LPRRRDIPPAPGRLLDWRDASHFDRTRALPCRYCGKTTHLRDDERLPSHKVCAEEQAAH